MSVGCQAEALKLLSALDLFGAIAFDNVADLDVLVTVDANAALVALLDRLDIVFEAAQRGNLALVDDLGVTNNAHLVIAGDFALGDVATGNIADLRNAEHVADLGRTGVFVDEFRRQHTDTSCVDVFNRLVDNAIQTNVDLLMLGSLTMMIASDAAASVTSVSVTPPTAE